ncbi:MAG: hypothetical protein GX876_11455 [Bacteroidales bacterium]|nr:hypothetical protein [Bacteroidales bacterium]
MKNIFASLLKSKVKNLPDVKVLHSAALLSSKTKEELIEILAKEKSNELDLNLSVWDELFAESALVIFETKKASAALLQQKLQIPYSRASKLIDQLEFAKLVGPFQGESQREILIRNKKQLDQSLALIAYDRNLLQEFYQEHKCEIDLIRAQYQELKEKSDSGGKKREPIPQEIMDKVWNRDGGKCVKCGSQENLEFDHIIPFSKGGATTYRNLQLLCKKCNLKKLDNIG